MIAQSIGMSGTSGFVVYDSPGGMLGPAVVNSYTTLSIPAYWRAMVFLSENMASFPRTVRKNGVDVPHRLLTLLCRRPNAYQDAAMFWRTLFFHRAHYLNGFGEIERDSQFNPVALHNRLPEQIAPFRWIDDTTGQLSQWYWVGGMKPRVVPFEDMIHLTGLSYDGISGLSPIFLLAETFERSRLLDRYVTRFLTKGSMLRGSIEIPAGASKEQQETIVETLKLHFRGADADRDVLILSDGATLNNKTLSPQDSQLVQQANFNTKQVAQITGVHPHFLYDDSEGKYNASPTQAAEDIVKWTFRPLLEQAECHLTLKLLSESEQNAGLRIHLDPNKLLRGDVVQESNVVTQQKKAGIRTANEARHEIGLPPSTDPNADLLKTSGDTSPVKSEDAGNGDGSTGPDGKNT